MFLPSNKVQKNLRKNLSGNLSYLKYDDKDDGLCSGDVGKHSVYDPGLTNQSAIHDYPHNSHQLHRCLWNKNYS